MVQRECSLPNDLSRDELTAEAHDYVWARLPFLVPMAVKIARTCCGTGPACSQLADLVDQLNSLVLNHLDHEEKMLIRIRANPDDRIFVGELADLSAEHRQLVSLLTRIRAMAGVAEPSATTDTCPTVHAFYEELWSLDEHLRAQILIEDEILGACLASTPGESGRHHGQPDTTNGETL